MKWTGKIVGFLVGWVTGGPFLAVLGIIVGHLFDKGLSFEHFAQTSEEQAQSQLTFFKTTFSVMGYIAKSDGRVSEEEILQARMIMDKMELDDQQRREAIHYFTAGKKSDFK